MARLILALMLALCASPALAQPGDWTYRGRDHGIHLRILRDYRLPAGATASEPVIVLGGSAVIDGRLDDDIAVIGGTLRIGRNAVVRGDAIAIGGRAIVDPGAQVGGEVDEAAILGPDVDVIRTQFGSGWWAVAAFGATVVRLALVLLVSLVLTVMSPGWLGAVGERAASTGTAALLGIGGQVLFVPALAAIGMALLISIIGIPLLVTALPLLGAAAAIAWAGGFAAVAVRLGRRLRGRGAAPAAAIDLFTGFAALSAVTLMAHAMTLGPDWLRPLALTTGIAGIAIEYIAWTIGLGAAIAALFGRRSAAPPPMPSRAPLATPS